MLAFGLVLLLFSYFVLVGSAVVRPLHATRAVLQDWLLAPAIGVIATIIPIFILSHSIGLPVSTFGPALTVVLMVAAISVHVWRFRQRRASSNAVIDPVAQPPAFSIFLSYLPFAAVLLVAACLVARPMFEHGFDWLSFCNDDMANYCLAADRFLRNGFLAKPAASALILGTDYSQTFWFQHVPQMVRPGAELAIAWTSTLTGLSTQQIFMPLIASFHLVVISAASATILTSAERRLPALIAAILLAGSAQLTFGTVYQLIAQDIGLAVLCANAIVLLRPFDALSRSALIRHGVLASITMTGQLLIYPEVNPFLGGGFILFVLIMAARRKLAIKPTLIVVGVGGLLVLLVLNFYTYDALAFMYNQRTQAAQQDNPTQTLFPFFLIPSGFANFWGFVQITSMPPDPGLSIAIVVGAVLLLGVLMSAVVQGWKGEPMAIMTLISAVLAVLLFRTYSGFGLYKLAMFAQVFVLPTLALAAWAVARRWRVHVGFWLLAAALALAWYGQTDVAFAIGAALFVLVVVEILVALGVTFSRADGSPVAPSGWRKTALALRAPSAVWAIAVLALPSIRVQSAYVAYSRDEAGATFNEVLGATRTKVLQEFRRELAAAAAVAPPQGHILCDAYNMSLSKLLAAYTFGRETAFPASRITLSAAIPNAPPEHARQIYIDQAKELSEAAWKRVNQVHFEFDPETKAGGLPAAFYLYDQGGRPPNAADPPDTLLVATTSRTTILNRRSFVPTDGNFVMRPLRDVRNHLLFVETSLSQPYYKAGDTSYISLYQIERDPSFYKDQTMAGVGRYFVFEVLNPDAEIRLSVDLTLSLKSDGQNKLPQIVAVGTERKACVVVGRGACRVISPPIKPQTIRGRSYVGIDLGEFGTQFMIGRKGAMTFFGQEVRLDRRLLVGFGRDISVVDAKQYAALKPPSGVYSWSSSDSALRAPDLEFSGFYEDGWVAEKAYLRLGQSTQQTRLVLRGMVPKLDDGGFQVRVTVKVDGVPVNLTGTTSDKAAVDATLGVGRYELAADVPFVSDARRTVDIEWSAVQQFQGEDRRQIAARLETIAFELPPK